MKRILSVSFSAVFVLVAASCGRSVHLGGDGGEQGGAGGADDDDHVTGGTHRGGANPRGGSAGSRPTGGAAPGGYGGVAGGGHPAGSGGAGGDFFPAGSGGVGGDFFPAGSGGVGGDAFPAGSGGVAGTFPAGSGGVAGNFPAGSGGMGGSGGAPVAALPTCITDLYEACWPVGTCVDDATSSTRCYEFGVKIVTESVPNSCGGTLTRFFKPDGTTCFSFSEGAIPSHACETVYETWFDARGIVVAERTWYTMGPPPSGPRCNNGPTVPCDIGAGGAGTHCTWPSNDQCEPGQCTPSTQ